MEKAICGMEGWVLETGWFCTTLVVDFGGCEVVSLKSMEINGGEGVDILETTVVLSVLYFELVPTSNCIVSDWPTILLGREKVAFGRCGAFNQGPKFDFPSKLF